MESHRVPHDDSEQVSPRVGIRARPDSDAAQAPCKLKIASDCEMFNIIKLGKQLGEGAYGCVFQALWPKHHKFIVVKKIRVAEHIAKMRSKQSQEALNEIQMLTNLHHPNIVKYFDSCLNKGEDDGSHEIHIYMEYMNQGSIRQLMDRFGPFRNEEVLANYARQILNGLNYLHTQNVIHGDIKAANILTDSNATIKLSDFGASKIVDGIPADLEVSYSGRFFDNNRGSLYWMAPEILCGEPYGRRSDIWALGCTIIEIATGKHPWESDEVTDLDNLKQRMLDEQLPSIPPELSPIARDFVLSCLKHHKSQRPLAKDLLNHKFIA